MNLGNSIRYLYNFRISLSHMIFKIGVLKNYAKFTGKHLCWSLFWIKLRSWRPSTLLNRDSNTSAFLSCFVVINLIVNLKQSFPPFRFKNWKKVIKMNSCFTTSGKLKTQTLMIWNMKLEQSKKEKQQNTRIFKKIQSISTEALI